METLALIHVNDITDIKLPGWYEVYTTRGFKFVAPGRAAGLTQDNGHHVVLATVGISIPTRHEGCYLVYVVQYGEN